MATEILNSEDDEEGGSTESVSGSGSTEEEEEELVGAPAAALCEQVVPLLRYLDRKVYKHFDRVKDERLEEFAKEKAKLTEALDSEQAQNRILSEELVRQTRLLEQCQLARQADEELIRRLQSECGELRAQRAEAESQLVVIEDDRRREADRTKEEMARRVTHCLRGYAHWEVAAQEKLTLRELELRAAGLLTGDSRSRRRVAKKLDSFLSKSRDTMATLETEVSAVLRRLGLRSRAEDWQVSPSVRTCVLCAFCELRVLFTAYE
ncbi:hypothetical protein AXG93_2062s1490 [Marchantia polymorpha subsp. ruderalis]|uniref:Cilia- and flagella-associated protein 157 n=1 Tax=Marchantia polymorpha subsp. ruderalis TaxID=1480154 RepID=A0A176VDX8_MARPO|nr:hypothetical protein AXG93_2062s1490 [Marchantia polymorpha subsp. ruderalis]